MLALVSSAIAPAFAGLFATPASAASNDVTFNGTVSLTGDPATDGTTYTYSVSDLDAVDNFTIDVTGRRATANTTVSDNRVGNGSTSISVGGSTEPEGPSTTEPQATLEGAPFGNITTPWASHSDTMLMFGCDSGTSNTADSETMFNVEAGSTISHVDFWSRYGPSTPENVTLDVYIHNGSVDGNYGDGTLVADGATYQASESNWTRMEFDSDYSVPSGTDTVVVELITKSCETSDSQGAVRIDPDSGASKDWSSSTGGGNYDSMSVHSSAGRKTYIRAHGGSVGASTATISTDAGASKTVDLSGDANKTVDFDMSLSASSFNWTTNAGPDAELNYTLDYKEIAETKDPTVEVNNGNTTSHSGTLADGSTTSLSVNENWIRNGTNRVNVTVAGSGGPTPQVGFNYSHRAVDDQTVSYQGETWTERYNVSKTWSSDQNNADLRIPFSSDRVVAVRDAEYRENGGSWTTITEAERSFDGSTLVLELGDVANGDTYEVRANGSKVKVPTGDITVTKPTTEGDDLETEIELTSWGTDHYIEVSGTSTSGYLHYSENESWASPDEHATIDSSGEQKLYLPGASSGATARIETIPLDVDTTGDVAVGVEETGLTPVLDVEPGSTSGDSVTYNYEHADLVTGEKYVLWSNTSNKQLDSDTAESPVTFSSTDEDMTVSIFQDSGGTSSSGGGGGGLWPSSSASREFVPVVDPEIVLLVVGGLLVGAVAYSSRSSPNRDVTRRPVVWLAGLASIVLALLFLAPSAIFEPVQTALSAILPLLGLVAVGAVALVVYGWYRKRKNESKPPTIEIGGRFK